MTIDFNILNEAVQDAEFANIIKDSVIKRDPFDPSHLVGLLAKYEGEIERMRDLAWQVAVVDDESCELATTYTTQSKKLRQIIDKEHKRLKEPYLNVTRHLDGFRKAISDRIQDIENHLNRKILPYQQKKEQERQAAERKAREEAAKLQAELNAKAKAEAQRLAEKMKITEDEASKFIEPAPIIVANVPEEVKTITETGSSKLKEAWAWEIEDFKSIPNDIYEMRKDHVIKALAPAINARIAAGIRNIEGIKIFKTAKIETRVKR